MTFEREYFCPILHKCPHWLDKCIRAGCQHPEAIAMREEKPAMFAVCERLRTDGDAAP